MTAEYDERHRYRGLSGSGAPCRFLCADGAVCALGEGASVHEATRVAGVPSPEEQARALIDAAAARVEAAGQLGAPAAAVTGIELGFAREQETERPISVVMRLTIVLPKAEAEQLAVGLAAHAAEISTIEIVGDLPDDLKGGR